MGLGRAHRIGSDRIGSDHIRHFARSSLRKEPKTEDENKTKKEEKREREQRSIDRLSIDRINTMSHHHGTLTGGAVMLSGALDLVPIWKNAQSSAPKKLPWVTKQKAQLSSFCSPLEHGHIRLCIQKKSIVTIKSWPQKQLKISGYTAKNGSDLYACIYIYICIYIHIYV
jgi:hypothetical protein